MTVVNLLVEGLLDETVMARVLRHVGLEVGNVYGRSGRNQLLSRLEAYNRAARNFRWVTLIDLESDTRCTPQFARETLPLPSPCMCFRVAVRSVEAWLMADRDGLAGFLQIPVDAIPHAPETLVRPKLDMVNLARRSRSSRVRRDMVPRPDSGSAQGPAYTSMLQEFVAGCDRPWRPDVAAEVAQSLRRCMGAVASLATCSDLG